MSIVKLLNKIKKQNINNAIKIILNIISYIFLRTISKEKSTERLLLKKVPIKCKIDNYNIGYNFELLTFLNNFETKEYLDIILDKKYSSLIDIWSNIWRISWISILHSKNKEKKIVLCDPNPFVFKLAKTFYEKNIHSPQKVYFLNNAISDTKTQLPFFMLKWDELNWIGSLDENNLPKSKTTKIIVESITFNDIIKKFNIWDKNILIKIDVEWHEKNVLDSIIAFFKESDISNIEILVEIREKNVEDISDFIQGTWYLKEFSKLTPYDYLIKVEK